MKRFAGKSKEPRARYLRKGAPCALVCAVADVLDTIFRAILGYCNIGARLGNNDRVTVRDGQEGCPEGAAPTGRYFRFACSISMSSVWVGAPPLQCLWYKWSSPLLASVWISGSTLNNLWNLSCT